MNKELLIAFLSVKFSTVWPNEPSEHWRFLFDYYNNNLPLSGNKLDMSRQSCYVKVFFFSKEELLAQGVKLIDMANA
jgi:hypothetical protein